MLDPQRIAVVLPFCAHDAALALDLLRWISELDKSPQPHPCLLTIDRDVEWSVACEALALARQSFAVASILLVGPFRDGWPRAANEMFLAVAEQATRPFLWLEPDCVPLKSGWLGALQAAYATAGKPFMGRVTAAMLDGLPFSYLPGTSVWPANAHALLAEAIRFKSHVAFDVAVRDRVLNTAHNTLLVHYMWGDRRDNPPTFAATLPRSTATMTLADLHPQAVLFHRNKDGSLIEALRRKLFPSPTPDDVCFVQGGRLGDLTLLLPAFAHWAKRLHHPVDVVSTTEFSAIFDGVSYVRPRLFPMHWSNDLGRLVALAHAQFSNVVCTQLHGAGVTCSPDSLASYSLSMWLRTGLPLDDYTRLPLVFDRRSRLREDALATKHARSRKPLLLASLESWTSPLPGVNAVKSLLARHAHAFNVVHLPTARGAKPYDQLGLMDRAAGLVTIDTFALHLAAASKVPVIALLRDDGQSGSITKCNVALAVGYSRLGESLAAMDRQLQYWSSVPVPA